jgi:hypothetical protein
MALIYLINTLRRKYKRLDFGEYRLKGSTFTVVNNNAAQAKYW